MRIISGKFKGTKIFDPIDKKTRPLKDMVKESIFNFLTHSKKISLDLERSNILDLYSGTGSFGLECLSRFADKVVFVEKDKDAIKILKKNIKKIKVENNTEIYFTEVYKLIKKQTEQTYNQSDNKKFDIVFCDPPFKEININKLVELIIVKNLIKKNGIIILHRHKKTKEKFIKYFKVIEERNYGISKIIFGQIAYF